MRTSRLIRSTLVGLALTLAFAASLVGVSAASAATKSKAASTPVDAAAGGPIDMQIWPGQGVEGDQTAIITVVEVDAKTKLPVTVRIPVTPGTTVEWAGEILGGPAESDIQQTFKLVQGQGGQFAEFTLTQSHRGQIDCHRTSAQDHERNGLRCGRVRSVGQLAADSDLGASSR